MIVLARGKLIAEGDAETIRNDPRVQEVYFGTGKTFQPHAPLHDAAGGHQDKERCNERADAESLRPQRVLWPRAYPVRRRPRSRRAAKSSR